MKKIYLSVLASLAFLVVFAAPDIYTPEMVAPANNQVGSAPNVELDWNAVTGQLGLHYEVQLSENAAFTSPVNFSTELTAYRMSHLMFGKQYFWRVRAIDNQGTSAWSDARNFTTIAKPVIRRPNNNATGSAPNVQIIWETISGVAFFDFQLDTVDTFDSPEAHITSVVGTLAQSNASSLFFAQEYYLRVRARHAADTSDWSVVRSFTVEDVFELKKPNDNSVGVVPDIEFEWNKIDGLEKYNLYVSTDEQFVHTEMYTAAKNLTKLVPDTLRFGVQYFWRMAAIHMRDTIMSDIRSFTVLDKATLNSPANNATNVELVPFLKWDRISGVEIYKLELSSNADMSGAILYSVNATDGNGQEQFKVPNNVLDSADTYYWRVKTISSIDTSNWSDTWNFRCVAVGVDEPVFRNGLRIYPAPAADYINIELKSGINSQAVVTLYDLLGKARMQREVQVVSGTIKDLQLGSLPNGIYMLRIEVVGVNYTSKVIVKR